MRNSSNCFCDDPDARCGHKEGFGEGREVFDLPVTVGVTFICRFIRDADRDISERGAEQV